MEKEFQKSNKSAVSHVESKLSKLEGSFKKNYNYIINIVLTINYLFMYIYTNFQIIIANFTFIPIIYRNGFKYRFEISMW